MLNKHQSTEITSVEGIYIELNLRIKNWLLCCTYNPNKNIRASDLDVLKRSLRIYYAKYKNLMITSQHINVETTLVVNIV